MNHNLSIAGIGLLAAGIVWGATGPSTTVPVGSSWDNVAYTTNKSTVTVTTSTNMQLNTVSDSALSSLSNAVQKVNIVGGSSTLDLTAALPVVVGTNNGIAQLFVAITNLAGANTVVPAISTNFVKNDPSATLSVVVTNAVTTVAPIIVSTNIMVPLTNAITAHYAWAACTNTLFRTGVSNGIIQSFSISGPTNGALNIWTISTTNVAIPTYNTSWQPSITEQPYIRLLCQSTNFVWVPLGTNYHLHCDHLARTFENKDGENKVYFIITAGAGNTMSNYTGGNTFFVTAGSFSN